MPLKIWHIWPKVSRVESSKHRQSAHSSSGMSSDRSRMGIAWKTQGRPQKHGGKAEGGTRGHADLLTNSQLSFKHGGLNLPYTEIQQLSPNILTRQSGICPSLPRRSSASIRRSFYTRSRDLFLQLFLWHRVYFLAVCCSITTFLRHVTLNWKWGHSKISQLKHFIYFLL